MNNQNVDKTIQIPLRKGHLEGELVIPSSPTGLVLFAHGSGSSRFSPRNQFVAKFLRENQLATFLLDLLTAEEEKIDNETRELRFDIELLADRLSIVSDWISKEAKIQSLPLGYFGSSTGAAAALIAAAKRGNSVAAVVSRGGRPDLAADHLTLVKAPTLLIVGGDDAIVIKLNEQAFSRLNCPKQLEIIPKATHLFEEPGTLEEVARLASEWFKKYLVRS